MKEQTMMLAIRWLKDKKEMKNIERSQWQDRNKLLTDSNPRGTPGGEAANYVTVSDLPLHLTRPPRLRTA